MPLPRTAPPAVGDERTLLAGFLDFHRETLALKCEGLADWQLRTRAVEPSALSLLGLVRHATDVERAWFERCLAGRDVPYRYWTAEAPEAEPDFDEVDQADPAEALAAWRAQIDVSREISAALPLDALGDRDGAVRSHRWVLLHMIEEYSRHNGHADLLRERLDGTTGV